MVAEGDAGGVVPRLDFAVRAFFPLLALDPELSRGALCPEEPED